MLSEFITETVFSKGLHVSKADSLMCGETVKKSAQNHCFVNDITIVYHKSTKRYDQYVAICLQTYLEEFKYKNTVYTDLWKHLQMVR